MARSAKNLAKGRSPTPTACSIVSAEDDGDVVLIEASPEGWKEQGRFKLDPQTKIRSDRGKIWTHPVIANGKLYLRDQDLVYCYDLTAH